MTEKKEKPYVTVRAKYQKLENGDETIDCRLVDASKILLINYELYHQMANYVTEAAKKIAIDSKKGLELKLTFEDK